MDYDKARNVLLRVLVLNWVVAAIKIILGILSGSIAILADGIHSFFDSLSNIIGLIGIHYARKPGDEKHPYGYSKYEALAALGIAASILFGALEMGRGIIERVIHFSSPAISFLYIAILALALAIDSLVAWYEYRWGKRLESKIIVADARHTATHILTTSSVIAGSFGVMLGYSFLDVIIASFVWFMVLKLALSIFNEARGVLTDSTLLNPLTIKKIAEGLPGVLSAHKIRSRGDRHMAFVDVHIEVDPAATLKEAHAIAHSVQEKIIQEIRGVNDVVVHVDPQ